MFLFCCLAITLIKLILTLFCFLCDENTRQNNIPCAKYEKVNKQSYVYRKFTSVSFVVSTSRLITWWIMLINFEYLFIIICTTTCRFSFQGPDRRKSYNVISKISHIMFTQVYFISQCTHLWLCWSMVGNTGGWFTLTNTRQRSASFHITSAMSDIPCTSCLISYWNHRLAYPQSYKMSYYVGAI